MNPTHERSRGNKKRIKEAKSVNLKKIDNAMAKISALSLNHNNISSTMSLYLRMSKVLTGK